MKRNNVERGTVMLPVAVDRLPIYAGETLYCGRIEAHVTQVVCKVYADDGAQSVDYIV